MMAGQLPSEVGRRVELTVQSLPADYVERVLKFVSSELESTRHLEFYLNWVQSLLTMHGPKLQAARTTRPALLPIMHMLHKSLSQKYDELGKICDFTKYNLQLINRMGNLKLKVEKKEEESDDSLESVDMNDIVSE